MSMKPILVSRNGVHKLDRKAHRRGGKICKRCLSAESVPILVAVDCSGTTVCSVHPSVTAESVECLLEPMINDDVLLVTDGNDVYPPCAKSVGVRHEALNQSSGERMIGTIHIQTVNKHRNGLKDFLRCYRGISSKNPGNYLRWFERCDLLGTSPGFCLATVIGA